MKPPVLEFVEPTIQLRPFVRRYIWGHQRFDSPQPIDFGPTGYEYFTLVLGDLPLLEYSERSFEFDANDARVCLAGQVQREHPRFVQRGLFANFGVELRPGASHYLFHHSADQLTDAFMRLPELDRDGYRSIIASWSGEASLAEGRRLAERYLEDRLAKRLPLSPVVEPALQRIHETEGGLLSSELAAELGVSMRTLRRHFQRVVGLSPQTYSKVYKLNRAIEILEHGELRRITEVAQACGYYDHSHFLRDFRQFLATTPRQFINGRHFYLKDYLGQF